jgi:molybdopterin-guanine dinucleotide biosynthesis protein A
MRAALVLAGGQARRMGGVDKALLEVVGVTMLDRVLAAAAPSCDPLVVVGPTRQTSVERVRFTLEPEPGGGPVPAVAAGLAAVPDSDVVVVLAVDLPLLEPAHVATLLSRLETADGVAAAADHRGNPNPLLAAYRADVLRDAIDALGAGMPASSMLPPATAVVDLGEAGTLNVNESADVERAERALDERILRARPQAR